MSMAFRMRRPEVRADYDRRADVLYISLGDPVECEGDGRENGIELDFSLDNGKPCGATIIGFNKNGWSIRVHELAKIIAEHIAVGERPVSAAVLKATRG